MAQLFPQYLTGIGDFHHRIQRQPTAVDRTVAPCTKLFTHSSIASSWYSVFVTVSFVVIYERTICQWMTCLGLSGKQTHM